MLLNLFRWFRQFWRKPQNIRVVLIRKTVQPMGTLAELYIDKEMVSFAYDTLPAGENVIPSTAVTVSVGNNAHGWKEIVVPMSVSERVVSLFTEGGFDVEILERWALRA